MGGFLCLIEVANGMCTPKSYFATKHPLQTALMCHIPKKIAAANKIKEWRFSYVEEYNALMQAGTWSLVPPDDAQSVAGCK